MQDNKNQILETWREMQISQEKFALQFFALKEKKKGNMCVSVCAYTAENILQNKSKTQRDKGSQKYIYDHLVY